MLFKNIVIGLLLNTMTVTQALTAEPKLSETEIAKIYRDHNLTKDKMIKMYEKFNIGKEKKLTQEQKDQLKPISDKYEDLDRKVKALNKQKDDEEAEAAEEVAKATEAASALPKEIPQKEAEVVKESIPVSKVAVVPAPANEEKLSEIIKEEAVEKKPVAVVTAPVEVAEAEPEAPKLAKEDKTLTSPKAEAKEEASTVSEPVAEVKPKEGEKEDVLPQEEKTDVPLEDATTDATDKSTQEEEESSDQEQKPAPTEEVDSGSTAQGTGVWGGFFGMFTGQPAAADAEVAEEEPVAVQPEKATAAEEEETEAPKQSQIMDGQLDSSKDESDKKAVGGIFGSILGSSEDAAPSESKSDDAAVVDKSEETEPKEESDEEPKQVEQSKLSANTNSTLASSKTTDELMDESQEVASPDLTIAFLILLGLGISVAYNQTQQDEGATQFNYKETNTLSTVKGDEASLFSSWHQDPNIGNRQRSHNLLQVQDEEINF